MFASPISNCFRISGCAICDSGLFEALKSLRRELASKAYWSQFDRAHPIEGPARAAAWTGTAHALIAELGVGSVTASALTMGLGIAAIAALLGLTLIVTGVGVAWAARPATAEERVVIRRAAPALA